VFAQVSDQHWRTHSLLSNR